MTESHRVTRCKGSKYACSLVCVMIHQVEFRYAARLCKLTRIFLYMSSTGTQLIATSDVSTYARFSLMLQGST